MSLEASHQLLPDEDVEVIKNGLTVLKDYLETLSPSYLPDIVVFADTSARPLAFAVKPLLYVIYSVKGKREPPCVYLQASGGPVIREQQYVDKFYAGNWQVYLAEKPTMKRFFEELRPDTESSTSRSIVQSRVHDIQQHHLLKNNARILVIDDYATSDRTTMKEIVRAFTTMMPECTVTPFVFLSGMSPFQYFDDFIDEMPNILIGQYDPRAQLNGEPPVYDSPGLSYKDNVRCGADIRERVTGVRKSLEKNVVEPSFSADGKLKHALRAQLHAIGLDIATHHDT